MYINICIYTHITYPKTGLLLVALSSENYARQLGFSCGPILGSNWASKEKAAELGRLGQTLYQIISIHMFIHVQCFPELSQRCLTCWASCTSIRCAQGSNYFTPS